MISKDLLDKKDRETLYNLVVSEYEEMGDNPDDATKQDVYEIATASGLY